ncbi:NAD(P)H-dependent oxidoreductase [Secundilactobacillus silagei]|uniref:NADPH-quinone reductase n=1 Tax=Secundilactobacillus silagei JCM 19001 TaxID=1302250 RepID=A0A1Z5IIG9_9LACO|nr:NAD(P)H-dependent oxidoreductase [Secundilactobacillus silagei]TDG72909.1 hypothetical protein C5L25_002198 [Secundilactobacillus silagei JCM 19001]GAX01567.1 NADPH-quinone reductase [Secundilactobacillus silagei JCM 19001]
MKTIIYSHPYTGSLNHAIFEGLINKFKANGDQYQVIDLYADHFDPVMTTEQLRLYSAGQTDDQLVLKYQEMLKQTDELIFVFPIWWYDLPAMLKGFIDKVMTLYTAYAENADGMLTGLLTNIRKTTLITTGGQEMKYFELTDSLSINHTFINHILPDIGIAVDSVSWYHYGTVHHAKKDSAAFLAKVIAAV